jgi:hypothetical protein
LTVNGSTAAPKFSILVQIRQHPAVPELQQETAELSQFILKIEQLSAAMLTLLAGESKQRQIKFSAVAASGCALAPQSVNDCLLHRVLKVILRRSVGLLQKYNRGQFF